MNPNATGLPTPRPSLELPETTHPLTDDDVSLLDSPLSSPSRVSGLMDPNATGLPLPRPSLELPDTARPLAIDDIVSTLKPLLEGTTRIRGLSIDGVTLEIVKELRARSRASKLPGWECLRYDEL